MNAKEMFENCGYELLQDDMNWLIYSINVGKWYQLDIAFSKFDKKVHLNTQSAVQGHTFDIQELKAINQQCKEIGWLDE